MTEQNVPKKIVAMIMAIILLCCFAMPVLAEEDAPPLSGSGVVPTQTLEEIEAIATKDALKAAMESNLLFRGAKAAAQALLKANAVNKLLTELLPDILNGMLDNDGIIDLALPLLEGLVKAELDKVGISPTVQSYITSGMRTASQSEILDKILDNEFIGAVRTRTIELIAEKLAGTLAGDEIWDAMVALVVEDAYNAPLVSVFGSEALVKSFKGDMATIKGSGLFSKTYALENTSLYSLDVTYEGTQKDANRKVTGFTVTGWDSGAAVSLLTGDLSGYVNRAVTKILTQKASEIIFDSIKQAAQEVISERVAQLRAQIKSEYIASLQKALDKAGIDVMIDPDASYEDVNKQVVKEVIAPKVSQAVQKIENTVKKTAQSVVNLINSFLKPAKRK